MISYNIIIGDTLTKVFQRILGVDTDNILTDRHFVIVAVTITFTFPVSLFRDVAKLGKVSFISLFLTAVIVVIIVTRATTLSTEVSRTEDAWVFAKPNAMQAIGVISFVFICHHNIFFIFGCMEEPSLHNWSHVTHVSVMFAVFVSLLFAVFGYVSFTGYTQGNIFENYCRDDDLATFGRFCYGFTMILAFPFECFVTREVIANVFFTGTLTHIFHLALTLTIVAVATTISLIYDCLGNVLELNGILTATPLVFVVPTACFIKLSTERWYHLDNIIPGLVLITGVIVMIAGLVMAVWRPQDCSHGNEMFYCSSGNATYNFIFSALQTKNLSTNVK
ncbi:putative sodium-coupled neutral amino acid transporter 11 [Lissotriton helveticus]